MQHLSAAGRLALAILLTAAFVVTGIADEPANLISNGGAEQTVKDGTPPGWFMASVHAPTLRLFVDNGHSRAGKACLAISNQHRYDSPVANNWGQEIRPIPTGNTVRLAAHIRTDDVGKVNVCVQCWADKGTRLVGFASTPVFHGTNGWTLAETDELVVPPETTLMIVRAALMGTGAAYFDDLSLEVAPRPAADAAEAKADDHTVRDAYAVGGAKADGLAAGDRRAVAALNTDLVSQVRSALNGRLVRSVPVIKDCMVLAYMPTWNHGNVDNIAVANNNGGVRTLMAWPKLSAEEIAPPSRRFFLALYCRKTTLRGTPGPIGAYEVLDDWNERTAWQDRPRIADPPVTDSDITPGEGWKFFDVTPLVRKHAADDDDHGAMLRFEVETEGGGWSGYAFASREAIGPWTERRPALLVVELDSSR
ncbi:MAG TPA: DNRLRE domain-containing protein [Pirellulales bacterium]|nr:DNRLRE domain-containing protein [Pirellulales bacterium]